MFKRESNIKPKVMVSEDQYIYPRVEKQLSHLPHKEKIDSANLSSGTYKDGKMIAKDAEPDFDGLAAWLIEKYKITSVLDISKTDGFRKHFQRHSILSRYHEIESGYYFIHEQKYDLVSHNGPPSNWGNFTLTADYNVKKVLVCVALLTSHDIPRFKFDAEASNEAFRLFNTPVMIWTKTP